MTACWSKDRNQEYPYQFCFTKGCDTHRKSLRREKVEGEFEALLRRSMPTEGLFTLAFDVFRDLWEARSLSFKAQAVSLDRERRVIDRQVGQLLERIVAAMS